ncbi:MAG TPA: hypothetical protein VGI39_44745, partial [Polyangiaceae bacterium]
KPAYLAPEQFLLERIDARTDIYGLGAVLFELLTGARSSAGPGLAPRAAVDVRDLRADVPEALARVIAKALSVGPDDRFATAEEMRRALAAARDACGLAIADESDVGAWARAVAEPAWSLGDLERELARDEVYRSELAAVSELPTIPEAPDSSRARTAAQGPKLGTRASVLLLAGSLLAAASGAGGWRYAHHLRARAAPGLRMASYAVGDEVPGPGVHVVVSQGAPDSSGWAHVAFDHITVTATSESRDVVVCLTPRAEGQRAFTVPAPSPDDPDPCADLHAGGYAGVNGVYPAATITDDWDLVSNPWELDFDGIGLGDAVSLRAEAIFGGAAAMRAPLGVLRTDGHATARSPFSKVTLTFDVPPPNSFWGAGDGRCASGDTIASWLDRATFANQPASAIGCPRSARSRAAKAQIHPVATPTMGIVGRIPAIATSECPGGEADGVVVWKSDRVPLDGGCVSLLLTGRFAQCASGDPTDPAGCPISVRCVPPPTDLLALADDGRILATESISCVPSYPEPVQYALTVRDSSVAEVSLALRRGASSGGCFFDLYDFTAEPGCH